MPFQLRLRHRLVVRALGQALFAHASGPSPHQLDALVDEVERHLAPVSPMQRSLLLVALDWVRWLPVVFFVSFAPFEGLPLTRRVALLERMEKSRATLLVMPFVAFKTLLALHFFEEPSELRAMGYPGDERKRWLRLST